MDPLVNAISDTLGLVLGPEHVLLVGVIALLAAIAGLLVGRRLGSKDPPQVEGNDASADVAPVSVGSLDPPATSAAAVPSEASRESRRTGFMAGFARSRSALIDKLSEWVGSSTELPELEELEEILIGADVGVRTAMEIVETLRGKASQGMTSEALRKHLAEAVRERIGAATPIVESPTEGPLVLLVVGVNGSGKTTTIGKLAARYAREGKSVMLAAGDTFRAGAIEQLKVWGSRAGVPVVAQQPGADPAAVIFDALKAAQSRKVDVLICDTAGRLQAQSALMDELAKVVRVMKKAVPTAPHEVLLVLDGTIGQNALSQAKVFKEVVGVTGVVLTKLDGTAKGGVVVGVRAETGLPVKLVGLGEGIDDLRDFDPDAFVEALLGEPAA